MTCQNSDPESIQFFVERVVHINTFFIDIDLAKEIAQTKYTIVQIELNCTSSSLYISLAWGFGTVSLERHVWILSLYFSWNLIISFDIGSLFGKQSIIIIS